MVAWEGKVRVAAEKAFSNRSLAGERVEGGRGGT
jgi:hypothetical protein